VNCLQDAFTLCISKFTSKSSVLGYQFNLRFVCFVTHTSLIDFAGFNYMAHLIICRLWHPTLLIGLTIVGRVFLDGSTILQCIWHDISLASANSECHLPLANEIRMRKSNVIANGRCYWLGRAKSQKPKARSQIRKPKPKAKSFDKELLIIDNARALRIFCLWSNNPATSTNLIVSMKHWHCQHLDINNQEQLAKGMGMGVVR